MTIPPTYVNWNCVEYATNGGVEGVTTCFMVALLSCSACPLTRYYIALNIVFFTTPTTRLLEMISSEGLHGKWHTRSSVGVDGVCSSIYASPSGWLRDLFKYRGWPLNNRYRYSKHIQCQIEGYYLLMAVGGNSAMECELLMETSKDIPLQLFKFKELMTMIMMMIMRCHWLYYCYYHSVIGIQP